MGTLSAAGSTTTPSTRPPTHHIFAYAGALLTILACAIWYSQNLQGAFGWDETTYARNGVDIFDGRPLGDPVHPPVGKYWIGLGELFTGMDEIGARAPIVVLAVAILALTFECGRRLRGPVGGLVAVSFVGFSAFFSRYAVQALFEIPLALAMLAALYLYLIAFDGFRWPQEWAAAVGATAAFGIGTRLSAVLFFPVVFVLCWRRLPLPLRHLFWPNCLGGAIAAGLILLIPFTVIPAEAGTPPFQQPVVAGISALIDANFDGNRQILETGFPGYVMGTFYETPPWWAYFPWLLEHGGLAWLMAFVLCCVHVLRRSWRAPREPSSYLALMVFVPFLTLALIPHRVARYLVPFLPLLAILAVDAGAELWARVRHKLALVRRTRRHAFLGFATVLVLSAILIPVNPIRASFQEPIGTDTRLDDVAAHVAARVFPGNKTIVYSYNPSTLRFYLQEFDLRGVQVRQLRYDDSRTLQNVTAHHAMFVVDVNPRPELASDPLFAAIRQGAIEADVFAVRQAPYQDVTVYRYH